MRSLVMRRPLAPVPLLAVVLVIAVAPAVIVFVAGCVGKNRTVPLPVRRRARLAGARVGHLAIVGDGRPSRSAWMVASRNGRGHSRSGGPPSQPSRAGTGLDCEHERRSDIAATIRFWAGARRAAGHPEEPTTAATIAVLRKELAARPELAAIASVSSFLIDGQPAADETAIPDGTFVDVLPPFAGG